MADGGRELGGWLRAGGRRAAGAAGAECGEQRALPNNALSRSKFFSLHTVVGLERLSIVPHGHEPVRDPR